MKEHAGFSFDYTGSLSRREVSFSIEEVNDRLRRQGLTGEETENQTPKETTPTITAEDQAVMDRAIEDAIARKRAERQRG